MNDNFHLKIYMYNYFEFNATLTKQNKKPTKIEACFNNCLQY